MSTRAESASGWLLGSTTMTSSCPTTEQRSSEGMKSHRPMATSRDPSSTFCMAVWENCEPCSSRCTPGRWVRT